VIRSLVPASLVDLDKKKANELGGRGKPTARLFSVAFRTMASRIKTES
jgi:hypothetical protein